MIERAMKRSGASAAKITTVKSAVALSVILAALILPQIVHAAAGASGGAEWLPMYIPVIIGGALLGPVWGLAVGISSPVVSFLITSALGSPMPVLTRRVPSYGTSVRVRVAHIVCGGSGAGRVRYLRSRIADSRSPDSHSGYSVSYVPRREKIRIKTQAKAYLK